MHIHPVLAGLANALFPGLGYLLIGERKAFGALLLVATVIALVLSLGDPAFTEFFLATTQLGMALEAVSYFLAFIAFGYDAYSLARAKQAAGSGPWGPSAVPESSKPETDAWQRPHIPGSA